MREECIAYSYLNEFRSEHCVAGNETHRDVLSERSHCDHNFRLLNNVMDDDFLVRCSHLLSRHLCGVLPTQFLNVPSVRYNILILWFRAYMLFFQKKWILILGDFIESSRWWYVCIKHGSISRSPLSFAGTCLHIHTYGKLPKRLFAGGFPMPRMYAETICGRFKPQFQVPGNRGYLQPHLVTGTGYRSQWYYQSVNRMILLRACAWPPRLIDLYRYLGKSLLGWLIEAWLYHASCWLNRTGSPIPTFQVERFGTLFPFSIGVSIQTLRLRWELPFGSRIDHLTDLKIWKRCNSINFFPSWPLCSWLYANSDIQSMLRMLRIHCSLRKIKVLPLPSCNFDCSHICLQISVVSFCLGSWKWSAVTLGCVALFARANPDAQG